MHATTIANCLFSVNSNMHVPENIADCYKLAMRTIEEIRLDNLNTLISKFGSIAAVAKRAEVPPNYLSQIKNRVKSSTGKPREVGSDLARKLEIACGQEKGWMDNDHTLEMLARSMTDGGYQVSQNLTPYEVDALQLVKIASTMSERGLLELIGRASELAKLYPKNNRGEK